MPAASSPVEILSLGRAALRRKKCPKQRANERPMVFWIELFAYATLAAGVLVMIWSLVRGSVSLTGLALLIVGLLIELLSWIFT